MKLGDAPRTPLCIRCKEWNPVTTYCPVQKRKMDRTASCYGFKEREIEV